MELTSAVRKRRMIRSYDQHRPVPRDIINGLLRLGIRAPSAGYTQGWQFLVLDDITARSRFWDATATGPADAWRTRMQTAPVLIVCFSDKDAYLDRYAEPDKGWTDRDEGHWPVPYWHIDTGMAAMIILLAAVDAGLAACLFGVPGERWDELRAAFGVAHRLAPVCVISLGYPGPDTPSPSLRRGRRPFSEVVHYGTFAEPTPSSPDGAPDVVASG